MVKVTGSSRCWNFNVLKRTQFEKRGLEAEHSWNEVSAEAMVASINYQNIITCSGSESSTVHRLSSISISPYPGSATVISMIWDKAQFFHLYIDDKLMIESVTQNGC